MIPHEHDDPYSTRQPLFDHMVTTHQRSPLDFRNKTFEEVETMHDSEHERRSGGERREDAAYNHPDHYGGVGNPHEVIKCIHAHGLDFDLGNAVKYILRAGKKDPDKTIEDLRKAIWYVESEILLLLQQ